MWQPAFTSNPFRENKPVHFLSRVTSCMWPLSHWMICSANQMQVLTWTVDAYDFAVSSTKQRFMCFSSIFVEHCPYRCSILFAGFLLLREGTFFIGRGGPGYFRIFWRKKSWPSHFLEWVNAWPFRNTQTNTSDPPPLPIQNKNNRKWK